MQSAYSKIPLWGYMMLILFVYFLLDGNCICLSFLRLFLFQKEINKFMNYSKPNTSSNFKFINFKWCLRIITTHIFSSDRFKIHYDLLFCYTNFFVLILVSILV